VSYFRAKSGARFELLIKKSRFLAIAVPVETVEDVEGALESVRSEFPDATHRCWAYALGEPGSGRIRFDDAGEPQGTAGKPILSVLQHRNLSDLLVVVVRYFGGVKLGAAGLVRAYSAAATGAVDALELVEAVPLLERRLRLRYLDEPAARRLLQRLRIEIASVAYGESVSISVRASARDLAKLERELAEETSGRAGIEAPSVGV
jgi:uncharacterized YigZ family protein